VIVDYWGHVLSRLAKGTGVVTADIDLVKQAETRARFPALDNRRLGLGHDAAVPAMSAGPGVRRRRKNDSDAVGAG